MRALTYLGPWSMDLQDRPLPPVHDGEAVIAVIATGICGSDAHGYSGATGRRVAGQVMGHEMVGRIQSARSLAPGTLVTVNPIISCGHCAYCATGDTQACPSSSVIGVEPALDGSFADILVVPEQNVIALPETMPILHGALIEPLAVGYHALMQGDPRTDDVVLIVGGGPIGQSVALGTRRAGIDRVLISEPMTERRALLEELGFAVCAPSEVGDELNRRFGGPATYVVDAVGIAPSIATALDHSVPRARIVLVGMGAPTLELAPYGLTVGERHLIGSYCYSQEHFASTAAWVGEGHRELDLLIDRTVTLDEGSAAFRSVAEGTAGQNKVLVLSAAGSLS